MLYFSLIIIYKIEDKSKIPSWEHDPDFSDSSFTLYTHNDIPTECIIKTYDIGPIKVKDF